MPADFSFDIVSEVSMPELTNAVDQASREIAQRFDFKGTDTTISRDDRTIELHSSTEDRLKAALEVLREKAVKREISLKALTPGTVQTAAKGSFRQTIAVTVGIGDEKAKELTKFIKGLGAKVQTQIQGEHVRVTGKKKDDLQQVIQAIRGKDFGIPLQFTNFRP